MKNGKPVIAWCGPGRSGKDTAAERFRDKYGLAYAGGSSWVGRIYMAKRLSEDEGRLVTPDEAYLNRHRDRMKWKQYLDEYRSANPLQLVEECLIHSDMVCGLRNAVELRAACKAGLINLAVWVENPRVKPDPTVMYTVDDCDILILNNQDIETYYRRLDRLAVTLGYTRDHKHV